MNLYKRGQIWWIKYSVGGKVYRKSTGATKYSEAQSWMAAIRTAAKMPTFEEAVNVLKILYKRPIDGIIALDDIWAQYEKIAVAVGKLKISKESITDRRNNLRRFITWLKSNAATIRTAEAINGAIAVKYAEHLSKAGISTKTRANNISNLSIIWKMLEKVNSEIRNPWENLAPADTDRKRLLAFSPEQEARILASAEKIGKDWLSVCIVARHTGLRYGDVATLKWREVDFENGVIHRKPSKTEKYGIAVTLPIIEPVLEALKRAEGYREREDKDAWVFPLHGALYGKKGRSVQALLNFREVLDDAGVKGNYTFHSWRHTAATRLAGAGVDIETRKRILGHTVDDTARRYDHDEHIAETRAALERAGKI